METTTKFLIVEDEMIIGANISLQLTNLGYEVAGIIPRGEEAISIVVNNQPDIILMDINLKGTLDGVETAKRIQEKYDIPIIYITANADEVNFSRAKATKPQAFISKPFNKLDLQRAIELTLSRIDKDSTADTKSESSKAGQFILSDSIFVKHLDNMVKIEISDILYAEAERNYCRIHARNKEYLLVMTLKDLDGKLPGAHFIRVHRSFLANISQIEEVGNAHLIVNKKSIPLSKSYKDDLLKRLQTI